MPGWRLAAALLVPLLATACSTPIGVIRGSTQEVYRASTSNVLSTGEPSEWSTQVLNREGLAERFETDPEASLVELRRQLEPRVAADLLFALAELSFHHAERTGQRPHYLAAAVYAYAFLFPTDRPVPELFDPRRHLAAELYNRGLARGLARPDGENVVLESGPRPLPFGELDLLAEPSGFVWETYRLVRFVPVGEFEVYGFRNRYRQPGIGVPLAAEAEPATTGPEAEVRRKYIPPRIKVPVTAVVRLVDPWHAVLTGAAHGRIEVYAASEAAAVEVDGRPVPLALEPTAALAYMLDGSPVWDFEIAGFRVADRPVLGDGLAMLVPHRRGRIPLVLVHGTASSPARWAELLNELRNDPEVRGRYEVWLYMYNTGQPVLYSALLLRRALQDAVARLDPDGGDPALRRMVVVGHSQGGLLTKLLAVDSGTRFWEANTSTPFEQVLMSAESRQLFKEAMFFQPLPVVERVVFIATPHRGSYRAKGLARGLVRRLVRLPARLTRQLADLVTRQSLAGLGISRLPTSVDNMSPGHPFIRTLADLPIDPRITAHSIIAVTGEGPPLGQTDGVVAYESAHLDGVASEVVVRSAHSCQGNPGTVEEMRRILREHAAGGPAARGEAGEGVAEGSGRLPPGETKVP
jgi:pimeloyl-ACP methyl ester carboxylesterase